MADDFPDDVADQLGDLTRVVTRQAGLLEQLIDDGRARDARERAGADVALLVDLLALLGDASACAATARTKRERSAFEAIANGLERIITGRGGRVVGPAVGAAFDAAQMDAVDVRATSDPALDRTVAELVAPGLSLATGRSVRPARVAVHRHRG